MKLSPGGFLIVDDYGVVEACRQAVDDYRAEHNIDAPIKWIDRTGIWWRRPPEPQSRWSGAGKWRSRFPFSNFWRQPKRS
jgi:DMSO/TMAO reductase YedYZ molybdopterin-dependent catalytic subunit